MLPLGRERVTRLRVLAASVMVASAAVVVVATPAAAAASCDHDPGKSLVRVTFVTGADPASTIEVGSDARILVDGQECPSTDGSPATLSNTSTIRVAGTADDDRLRIDLGGGSFGAIGWNVDLAGGLGDTVEILGQTEPSLSNDEDEITVGADGFAMDKSTGSHANVESFVLNGRDGPDTLSAAGGLGSTGGPFAGHTTIVGGLGSDLLRGGVGPDRFEGGQGRDLLSYEGRTEDLQLTADGIANDGAVGEGDDIENALAAGSGGHGIDSLLGGAGDDVIEDTGLASAPSVTDRFYCAPGNVGASRPDVCGGPGADLFPEPHGVAVSGGSGVDTADWSTNPGPAITCDSPARTARLEDDVEVQIGSDDEEAGDSLCGSDGPNVLIGGRGDDELDGGLGADELEGGDGRDAVRYTSHDAAVTATLDGLANDGVAGEDFIHDDVEDLIGGAGADHLVGDGTGNLLIGGLGPDVIEGGEGADELRGGQDSDELHGGGGADRLRGGFGEDLLLGEGGRDTLEGEAHDDELSGGDGNDLLDGGLGGDRMAGDAGERDTATYESREADVRVSLRGGDADDGEAGEGDTVFDTVEWVLGGSGNDTFVSASRGPVAGILAHNTFVGNGGRDTLKGGGGDDVLVGGEGNDRLLGGAAEDGLLGGDGEDTLEGEGGADRLEGGDHEDTLRGGGGGDVLLADDGWADSVVGGPGSDTAHVDPLDDVTGCEDVD
jgi:Ca2+-binding RTX toxin-like protein